MKPGYETKIVTQGTVAVFVRVERARKNVLALTLVAIAIAKQLSLLCLALICNLRQLRQLN